MFSERRELADVIKCAESPEIEKGGGDGILRRWIHEIEFKEVTDAEGFQKKDGVGEVGTLDFGDCLHVHFVTEGLFGIEAVSFPWAGSTSAAGTLGGVGLRDWCDLESVHAHTWVVDFEFRETGVDNEHNSVDSEGGFGDVGGDDDFASTAFTLFKDFCLHVGWHLGIDWENVELWRVVELCKSILDHVASDFDIFLTSHEN